MDPTILILSCVLNFQTKSQLNLIQTSLTNVQSESVLFLNKFRQNIVFPPKFVEYGVLPSFKNVLLYEDSLKLSLNSFTSILFSKQIYHQQHYYRAYLKSIDLFRTSCCFIHKTTYTTTLIKLL